MRPLFTLVAALAATSMSHAAIITYNAAPYTGDPATAQVTFKDGADSVGGVGTVTVSINLTGGTIADIRGLFLNVANPALLSGMTVSGTHVTSSQFGPADSVNNLTGGLNSNPATGFDLGVEIGTPGIGSDDIPATTFVLSRPMTALTNADFNAMNSQGLLFALRLMSVGPNRNGSSKLSQDGDGNGGGDGDPDGDLDPEVVPEPATLVTVAMFGGMGLIGYRLRRKKA